MSAYSVPSQTPAYGRGQLVGGFVALAVVILLVVGVSKMPWGMLYPVLDFIGRYPLLNALGKAFIVVNFIAIHVLFLIWWERKFAGWMQARVGPMHVG